VDILHAGVVSVAIAAGCTVTMDGPGTQVTARRFGDKQG
jgi:hypothetical protein